VLRADDSPPRQSDGKCPSPQHTKRTASSTFDRVAIDLTHAAFPEFATAIRTRIDRILKHWRKLSLTAMPHLDAMTLEEFEDTIADILSAAAHAIQSADSNQLRGVVEHAPGHGIDRFVQRYSLLDLFEEVRILRGVVIRELAEQMQRPLEVAEAATFHAIFDIIIQHGVMALVERQNEELQKSETTLRGGTSSYRRIPYFLFGGPMGDDRLGVIT
jgi:hypothetical protein